MNPALLTTSATGRSALTARGVRWDPAGWSLGMILAGLIHLTGPAAVAAEPLGGKEYQIKAAFLFNFTKFVEWPPERFADDTSPIVIAVLAGNPFGGELEKVVKGRKVNGRDIVVTTVTARELPASIHLLFVHARGEEEFGSLTARLREAGVLTVGESDRFITRGGVIAFTLAGDKVRFEINQSAAEQARLKLSAQLLKLATTVRRNPDLR